MRNLLPFLVLTFICSTLSAQTIQVSNLSVDNNLSILKETNQYKLAYSIEDCNVPSDGFYARFIKLSITNLSNQYLEISFEPQLYYDGTCTTCELDENEKKRTISIAPGTTITPNCKYNDPVSKQLRLFVGWTRLNNTRQLTTFSIENINFTLKHKPE